MTALAVALAPQIAAGAAVVTATTAIVTACVAVWTLLNLRRDSRARTRPVVIAEMRPRLLAPGTVELIVRNVGPGVARNMTVTFDPPLPEQQDGPRRLVDFLRDRYGHTFGTFGPGQEITNIYAQFRGEGARNLTEPVPWEVKVTIRYSDSQGEGYEDVYDLSPDIIMNQTVSVPSSTDAVNFRKRFLNALETIARGVGRK